MNQNNALIPADSPKQEELEKETSPILEAAKDIVVDSDSMYQIAGEDLRKIKGMERDLETRRKAITVPMDAAKKSVMDLFRQPLAVLAEAEQHIKRAMGAYDEKQRIEAARIKKIADAAAEAERKRLADLAAEAEQAGDMESAFELQTVAEAVTVHAPATHAPRATGIASTERWSAEISDKRAFIEEALRNEQYFDMVQIDMRPLNQMAVALKDKLNIPGVKAIATRGISARA